jgi:glycosyltransferase involved in cell wall biosynthesis
MKNPTLSFVIPCLNEEKTLPLVLEKIFSIKEKELSNFSVRVIVSDNGSSDKSIEIAKSYGSEVVNCKTRGYGAALDFGIRYTDSDYVVFADADDTYDFTEAPKLFFEAIKGFDLVIENRLNKNLHSKSIPFLHRYLGTPVLNGIINFLYSSSGNKIKDCNSGFRCFNRNSYLKWNITGTGMEFASEMLVKALSSEAKISHIDVTLHPDKAGRVPHLRTWRDGMRHLLQILVEAPKLFYQSGIFISSVSFLGIVLGWFLGPIKVGIFNILGIHTMLIFLFLGVIGLTIFSIGLGLSTKKRKLPALYEYLINLSEDKLFWFSLFTLLISLGFIFILFFLWAKNGFSNIDFSKDSIFFISLGTFGIQLVSSIIFSHLIKRA